jgi:hypothetical protein
MDGRTIEIGTCSATNGGWIFKEPHLESCWIANDFDFSGYDTLYLAPTLSTTTVHGADEEGLRKIAKDNMVIELNRSLLAKKLFLNIVTHESDIKPSARVLKLENTIIEYAKGSESARYWGGMFGGGQPVLGVTGKMTDGDKTVFSFEARRSGVSLNTHLFVMSDLAVQLDDIRSLALDLTDFMAAVAGKYQPKN